MNKSVIETLKAPHTTIAPLFFAAMLFASSSVFAQSKELKPEIIQYIETYRSIAQEEMLRSGIPASITLAQGIHESNIGKSVLATDAKNHFGIKCHKEWAGPSYTYDDDAIGECFRVYNNAEHSYRDHSDFLTSRSRYAGLFTLDRKDYKGWATGLKAAGYATNPKYPEILVRLIEEYKLHEYDDFNNATYASKPVEKKVETPVAKTEPETPAVLEFQTIGSHNGIACVVLERKATPAEVAAKYNIALDDLLSYNEMEEGDIFRESDRVYFAHKKKVGETELHTVEHGESMWTISQKHGVKLHKLYEKNRMKMNDQPVAGETIYLQTKRETEARTMSYEAFLKAQEQPRNVLTAEVEKPIFNEDKIVTASTEKIYQPITSKVAVTNISSIDFENANITRYYEVQPKETLYSIARMFNLSVGQLSDWNNLNGTDIKVGQQLIVGKK
jgi:LysM repeat protein